MGATREARELYVQASGLWDLWNQPRMSEPEEESPVTILDVGLGLGYNAVTTITAWLTSNNPTSLLIQSLEIDSTLVEAFISGNAPWQTNWQPEVLALVGSLKEKSESHGSATWSTTLKHPGHDVILEWSIHVGDARQAELSPALKKGWDFIWQDPFSPDKNPGMWTKDWFAKVLAGTNPNTVLMTYSVARGVRDALTDAGWLWEKVPSNSGIKRHWLRAKSGSSPSETY
jgi:tRNA 5-methylaminomethyl-2-thiouridine biosynthesis bifunctional protein